MKSSRNRLKSLIVFTILAFSVLRLEGSSNKPSGLLTDLMEHTELTWQNGYVSNIPIGQMDKSVEPIQYVKIASLYPFFSWVVPSLGQATVQVSYQILVSSSYKKSLADVGDVWDSNWVESGRSTAVQYGGQALQPDSTYFWRVKTKTNTGGESEWSDIKAFRTASVMREYAASSYPLAKTMEYPRGVKLVAPNTYLADFKNDAFAQMLLTLSSASGQDTVYIHLGENLSGGRIDRKPGGTIRYRRYIMPLLKGTHTYRVKITRDKRNTGRSAILMPTYIGEVLPFRYCEIEGYARPLVSSDIVREIVHYQFNELASSFSCNNDTLNQIWNLCKYSIKATSFAGVYVDGDRERIPYEADALINQLCHYGVDREYSMARRSLEYLLDHPTWPTEWLIQAVLIAWHDYMYTGDNRSLKLNYNILKARTLLCLKEKNGFISTTTGLQTPELLFSIRFKGKIKDIVDWPHTGILGLNKKEGGEADGFVFSNYNAVTNAYHYEALKLMARIAAMLGLSVDAASFTEQAVAFMKQFNSSFFNSKTGCYIDGIDVDHSSLHANIFPLAFGMVSPDKKQKVVNFIESRGMACSVYGSQFLMDALYEAGDAEYALQMLTKTDDRSWYNMIRVGSTISLEAWDNKYKPNQDWNHAWGAAPANLIPRRLMGVEPLTPGYSLARIKPQLGSLEWARATIPTIKGEIRMAVENKKQHYRIELSIPANMEAEVYLPLPAGKYEVHINGSVVKTTRVKDDPFLYAGKIPSGTYTITMDTK